MAPSPCSRISSRRPTPFAAAGSPSTAARQNRYYTRGRCAGGAVQCCQWIDRDGQDPCADGGRDDVAFRMSQPAEKTSPDYQEPLQEPVDAQDLERSDCVNPGWSE